MLKVKDVQKSFGGVKAIQGSTFELKKGQITALIGPNGAGKTTLFDIITGFLFPDSGAVLLSNSYITKKSPHYIANKGISRTFQQVRLFKYLTILDHLRMTDDNEDMKLWKHIFASNQVDRGPYEEIRKKFGIERGLDTEVHHLSYGQRKLLQIAMALRRKHSLLLLDEPVAGVNSVVQKRIENILLELKEEGETILLIDHDMSFIRRLADRVIVLDAGVVLRDGKPATVLKDKAVLEAYLGE